jgi:hypothetical protein
MNRWLLLCLRTLLSQQVYCQYLLGSHIQNLGILMENGCFSDRFSSFIKTLPRQIRGQEVMRSYSDRFRRLKHLSDRIAHDEFSS